MPRCPIPMLKKRSEFLRLQVSYHGDQGGNKLDKFKAEQPTIITVFKPAVVVTAADNPEPKLTIGYRFGFTATKKLGGAVKRNRAKRLIRQVIRQLLQQDFNFAPKDYVLIARTKIFTTQYSNLQRQIKQAMTKLKHNN